MENWLIDETRIIDVKALEKEITHGIAMRSSKRTPPALAIRINDLIIHDTKKWFGLASNIRVDTLVVHGSGTEDEKIYHENTFRFSGIKDNQRLAIEHPGQKIFYGHPNYFMDISIFVSRDTGDSDELSSLINSSLNSQEWKDASSSILALTSLAPQAGVIASAVGGAASIANVIYKILKNVTGNTIGLYRSSYLQKADSFGIGRHPDSGSYRQQDFSFWYEVLIDKKMSSA